MELRFATTADAAAIADIYNHYVANTSISFEEDLVSVPAMSQRIADLLEAGYPWIVATLGGKLAGYAYASKWRVRAAYRFAVESSVYLHPQQAGQGLGTALYTQLIAQLRTNSIHLVIGGIALPNPASIALHEKMGFRKVAHFSEVGRKFDRWVDVGYWQLTLPADPAQCKAVTA